MKLFRELRRSARRTLNQVRRVLLFVTQPVLLALDCLEWGMFELGIPDRVATRITQAVAGAWLLSFVCACCWTAVVHPAAPPAGLLHAAPVVLEIRYSYPALAWVAGQCCGGLCLVIVLTCHKVFAAATTCLVIWPRTTGLWLTVCGLCWWLVDDVDGSD